jgi:hypothetical protein
MPMYTFLHNLLNVLVQIANKMGLQQNYYNYRAITLCIVLCTCLFICLCPLRKLVLRLLS